MFNEIQIQSRTAICELIDIAKLKQDDIVIIGCSSSEVIGHKIGTDSNVEAANSIFNSIYAVLKEKNIYLAAQCCEHLNRAIIIEQELAIKKDLQIVNVVPQPKAGGSFATAAYYGFKNPVAVEHIKADSGIDIGGTLIGMHLKEVAVPVKLSIYQIGQAHIICARTRPKYIGGIRAHYNDNLI